MTDLSHASMDELKDDRQESHNDLVICAIAKIQGSHYYFDGEESIDGRIEGNIRIIQIIDAEIKRRKAGDGS